MKAALCMLLIALIGTGAAVLHGLPAEDSYSGILVVIERGGQGSCVIVTQQNGWWYAVTAQHVVGPIGLTIDGYEAEIVQRHSQVDLALIRFQSPETYRIYEFAEAVQGEMVVLVGWYDEVRLNYYGHVVTTDWNGQVATNTGIFPGCSGGAVFNKAKQVIGITISMGMTNGHLLDSTAFCVPGRYAAAMVPPGD